MVVGIMAVLSPVNQGDDAIATDAAQTLLAAATHVRHGTGPAQDVAMAFGKGWSELDPSTRDIMMAMAISGLKDGWASPPDESRKAAVQGPGQANPRK